MSALKEERVAASKKLRGPKVGNKKHGKKMIEAIRQRCIAPRFVRMPRAFN